MKLKILFFLTFNLAVCSHQYSQDIINILGTNGVFKIKDASNDFLTLSQSTGNLSLNRNFLLPIAIPGSQVGIVFKGNNSFIHDYRATGTNGLNTFLGLNAGNFTMYGTGSSLLEASYNTGIGHNSLGSLTTGYQNSALGMESMFANTTGYYNSAIWYQSLRMNTDGFQNSAFGHSSLYSNITGNRNSAFGYSSLKQNTTGYSNSSFGVFSLINNTTGSWNSAFGQSSLASNTTGYQNSGFGMFSLSGNTTGYENSAFGVNSLPINTTGYQNCAFGFSSLFYNTTAIQNTAVGHSSLRSNTTGNFNTALGFQSLYLNYNGFQNTAVGHHSLQSNNGNYNTALGYNAGSTITGGSNLTCIGIDAAPTTPNAINQVTLGNIFVTSLRCAVTTITSLSDKRDKKNIKELSLGLDFITKLKPRQFNWDKREWYDDNVSDGSKMTEAPTAGFIAQELDSAQTIAGAEWLNLVLKDNPEKWEATPGNLLPIVVKAVQELKAENDELKDKLAKFEQLQSVLAGEIEKMKSGNNETREVKLTGK